MKFRIEKDSLGEIKVPNDALWGAGTQRAIENFPVNSASMPKPIIKAFGLIKKQAAIVNKAYDLLNPELSDAIEKAADEVAKGKLHDQFPVDVFQTGSGTSTNMNANEVIANRAIQILGCKIGSKEAIHPNDHVNMCQSSNDVFPTAIHLATYLEINEKLIPALNKIKASLDKKAVEFDPIIKVGRTHLQDALPMKLGQEFSAYSAQITRSITSVQSALLSLARLPLGGTAIGTGLNAHKNFAPKVIEGLSRKTKFRFSQAENLFESLATKGGLVKTSGALKELAIELSKIANDIRWLSSGPRAGLFEIKIPSLQPGSSIMPGKVNPVIPEMMLQICAQAIGNDTAITLGAMGGNFELNVMMPLMAKNILESIEILSNGIKAFDEKCIMGIEANRDRCKELVEKSLMLGTNLTKKLGYDKVAEVAKEAYEEGKTIREIVLEKKLIPKNELDKLLDPSKMV